MVNNHVYSWLEDEFSLCESYSYKCYLLVLGSVCSVCSGHVRGMYHTVKLVEGVIFISKGHFTMLN